MDMTTSSPLPLTTVFTPPASCVADINWYTYTPSQTNGLVTIRNTAQCVDYLCYAAFPLNSNCFPKGWALSQAFSPGVCPEDYTIACSSLTTSGTATETVATCCPKNFECISTVYSSWPWQSTESCTSIFTQDFELTYTASLSDGGLGLSSLPIYSGWGVNANSVQIRFQSTDTTALNLTVATGTASSDVTAITLTTGLPFPLSTSLSGSSSGIPGLSTGTKIGIGVAVPIFVITTLVGVFIIWWRLRHRRSTRQQLVTSNPEQSMRGYPREPELDSVIVPIVSPLSPQGTQFQGPAAELDHNPKAYIQETGAGKKDDDDDLGGMRKELDGIEEERNRILRLHELAKMENTIRKKMAQGGNTTEVGEMEG